MIGRAHGQAGQELKYRRQKEHVEIFASHSDLSLSLNVLHIDHRSISCLRNLSRCLRLTSNPERRVRTENEILRSNSRYTISGKWSTFFFQWSTVMLIRNQKSQIESERLIKGKKRGGGGELKKVNWENYESLPTLGTYHLPFPEIQIWHCVSSFSSVSNRSMRPDPPVRSLVVGSCMACVVLFKFDSS